MNKLTWCCCIVCLIIFCGFSAVDEYGFERHEDFDYESYEDFMSIYLKVLATRAQKWATLLGEGKSVKRTNTVKRYVRKGVPSECLSLFTLICRVNFYPTFNFFCMHSLNILFSLPY